MMRYVSASRVKVALPIRFTTVPAASRPTDCGGDKGDMVTFTPASEVWTLGYNQFDDVCWRHNKTQELFYIPPGQPLVLPPRSLACIPRSNLPNDPRLNPAATAGAGAYALQGYGGGVHFDYNSALNVPEAARLGVSPSVEVIKGHPSSLISAPQEANQWLHPRSLVNVPRPDIPNGPISTPATTMHAGAFPQQGVGEEVQSKYNPLGIPDMARISPPPVVEDNKPRQSPQMSRAKGAKHGLPQRSLANVRHPNLPKDSSLTPVATTRSQTLPAQPSEGAGEGEHFNNDSTLDIPESALIQPTSLVEGTKPRLSPPMSTANEPKHVIPKKSFTNVPRPDLGNNPHSTIAATTRAGASSLQKDDEGGNSNNNYAPNVPGTTRVPPPPSTIEDTIPHPTSLMTRPEGANQWLNPRNEMNGTGPGLSNAPHVIPAATTCAEAFPVQEGGEGVQFNNNSVLNVPEGVKDWPASEGKETKPRSSPISREEKAEQWSRKHDKWGNEYYFNSVTGESQSEKPDCLKKYTCRS